MKFKDIFQPKWKHHDLNVRVIAAKEITDKKILADIAKKAKDEKVRLEATKRLIIWEQLHEEELINQFLHGDVDSITRAAYDIHKHIRNYSAKWANDDFGKLIISKLCPVSSRNLSENWKDVTGGRPDTWEWLVLAYLNDTLNPFHFEYLNALKSLKEYNSKEKLEWARKAGIPL